MPRSRENVEEQRPDHGDRRDDAGNADRDERLTEGAAGEAAIGR
jgi:hypothetical protein